MTEFVHDVTSFHWWLGVVLVGVLINLASDYLKPRADGILGSLSTWYATRTVERRLERQQRIDRYIKDKEYRYYLSHFENGLWIKAIIFLLCGAIGNMCAIYLLHGRHISEIGVFFVGVGITLYLASTLSSVVFVKRILIARAFEHDIAEARRILDERPRRRTEAADNA